MSPRSSPGRLPPSQTTNPSISDGAAGPPAHDGAPTVAGWRRLPRFRRVLVAVGVLAVLVVVAVLSLRPAKGGSNGANGEVAPLFASTDLSGHPIDLRSYRGHRVVLNFWASWCIPCRAEFPILKQLEAQHPDVIVLGVVFADADASASDFMRSQGATWPGVRDPDAQIADAYGVHAKPGIPVSVLISPTGTVVDRRYGALASPAAATAFVNESPPT